MEKYLLISDAAKAVQVESHVLRYWEEELHLPIKRNELGHRYYTQEDVDRFKNIKSMKERGLQLKAIKMILKNGKLDLLTQESEEQKVQGRSEEKKVQGRSEQQTQGEASAESAQQAQRAGQAQREDKPCDKAPSAKGGELLTEESTGCTESREEKAQRLQWIMQQLIRQAVRENNAELVQQIKESVLKELDYQFRMQEERQDERAKQAIERTETYYRQMDELLRKKSRKGMKDLLGKKSEKKKKHFAI